MKLLVTGGAGFMGSNFVRYILREHPEWQVTNLDKLTYAGNLENLKDVEGNPNYRFIKGDVADSALVRDLVKEVDLVVNYAAETHVDRSIASATPFLHANVLGVHSLLEAVREAKRVTFIHISTDEVFGSIRKGKFTEDSLFQPSSPYAASKASGDLLCRAYWVTHRTPVIVSHAVNFYGPYQYPEKFIPLAITNLLEGKNIPLYGEGSNRREWLYTEDHCRAIDLLIAKGTPGEVYNISSGEERSNLDLARAIMSGLAKDKSSIERVTDRPGHDFRYSLDWTKIGKLGWQPKVRFDEGLKRTIEWYSSHATWWQRIKSGEFQQYYERRYGRT